MRSAATAALTLADYFLIGISGRVASGHLVPKLDRHVSEQGVPETTFRNLRIVLLAVILTSALLMPALAQHENDLLFGVTDGKMAVEVPTTYEVPKVMYYNGSYWIRDQGIDGVLVSGSTTQYEFQSVTWKQVSFTPGFVLGGWFGQDWLGGAAKPGYANLDDGDNRHIHKNVMAGAPGTYLLTTYLTNGVDHEGNAVEDSDPWTMIWVTSDTENIDAPVYAQVDLELLRNLPDTPSDWVDNGFAGVDVDGLVVSAVYSLGFYAQTEGRTGGVFVQTSQMVELGDLVRVKGTLSTSGSERIITATEDISTTSGEPPKPLGVSARFIGGSSAGRYAPGTTGGVGLSTTGLLVRMAGTIHIADSDIYICDGSQRNVKISQDMLEIALTLPGDGGRVIVTGISGTNVDGDDIVPVIRPRGQNDILSL